MIALPRRTAATSVAITAALSLGVTSGLGTTSGAVGATRPTLSQAATPRCSAGAHTLSASGAHVYPETGNGGYTSRHTIVNLVYDASTNKFLAGTNVVLTDRAKQCLRSFSLDFERQGADSSVGPDLGVRSIMVDGVSATYRFEQPTYPGDPHGAEDPDPRAHEASQVTPVGGPDADPLPPACSPEIVGAAKPDSLDGTQCPANKLVITPTSPIPKGAVFTVKVAYSGRPGVHNDGDGTTEGWFRAPDGGFVTTEPVGSEDWMPLNDYPAAKPTYTFNDTVNAGKTAVANGILTSTTHHAPSAAFAHGSTTWHWRATEPVASYLVEDSVGDFAISSHLGAHGVRYYAVQDTAIPAAQRRTNAAVIAKQPEITAFESGFNGAYPFSSAGVVVGTPDASFEEEMETMITFAGSEADTGTLYHENMHQWWGDHVTEGSYAMTFYKEGLATLAEQLGHARKVATPHGGRATASGRVAFNASLRASFDTIYGRGGAAWSGAPSNPTPDTLFDGNSTYDRPSAAYLALRQILGHAHFVSALHQLQVRYGGRSITEPQLETGFAVWLPVKSAACSTRLSSFFTQWFDTAYPAGGGASRPTITGPGLAGQDFYGHAGCTA